MNKILKVIISILGGCSVVFELLTPIAVALVWGIVFNLSSSASKIILVVGGLATLFRAIKIGFIKNAE